MKAVKITNALWLGSIGPHINDFSKKVVIPGITYESLFGYFTATVQFGGDMAEFWVIIDEEKPTAFAHWFVRGLPAIGKVFCDWIYSWTKDSNAVSLLLDEYEKFGLRHRAVLFEGEAIDEVVFRAFRKACTKKGYTLTRSNRINFTARKQIGGEDNG